MQDIVSGLYSVLTVFALQQYLHNCIKDISPVWERDTLSTQPILNC